MSKIIQLSDLEGEDREAWKFAQGKASKQFVIEEVYKANTELQDIMKEELQRSAQGFSQLFTIQRIMGLQVETLIRMLDRAVPEFRTNFGVEYKRTVEFSTFIDTLNGDGQHSAKPMLEKVDLARDWNKDKDNLKIKGFFFGLPNYILSNPTEFTEDQVELLALEFEFPEIFDQYKSLLSAKKPVVEETVVAGPVVQLTDDPEATADDTQ